MGRNPFRFWCDSDDDSNDEDHPGSAKKDSASTDIVSVRDLEDFARLHLYIGGFQEAMASGTIQVGLEWRNLDGNSQGASPSIKIYQAAEPDGGTQYLTDDTGAVGLTQWRLFGTCLGTIDKNGGFKFKKEFFGSNNNGLPALTADQANRYLIFEGVTEGKGQLVLTFWNGTTKIGEGGSAWLDIKNVRKMYERAKAVPDSGFSHPAQTIPGQPPEPSLSWVPDPNGNPFEKPENETKTCVVFVHGWNMPYNDSANFADTFFKRLWLQGYKGRFCIFRWPTLVGVSTYNTSEYRAWKYGTALNQYVTSLLFDHKNVVAHSMGNVVVGSALLNGMAVENYVLMQAAVPAGCYDESSGINSYSRFLNQETIMATPDYANPALGYRGLLKSVSGNLVNFNNSLDFALATGTTIGLQTNWEANETDYKWDIPAGDRYYQYIPSATANQRGRLMDNNNPSGIMRYVIQRDEMMSFIARPRSKAVGAENSTGGSIDSNVDLRGPDYGFTGADYDHSGEFNRRIQQTQKFYRKVGTSLGVLDTQ